MSMSFEEWQNQQEIKLEPSKRKQIEALFNEIESSQKKGAKLWQILDWLNQSYDLNINLDYLQNALYRIRKKQGQIATSITPNETTQIQTQSVTPATATINNTTKTNGINQSTDKTNEEILSDILARFRAVKDLKGRYEVLGGNVDDFKNRSITDHRQLVINLKMKVMQKYGC